jgi:hypothetical protein
MQNQERKPHCSHPLVGREYDIGAPDSRGLT